MLEMCEGDIYDHFWALIRTLYIFQLRHHLQDIDEKFQPMEKMTDSDFTSLGVPTKIPHNWPQGFEGVLRVIQQKYTYLFSNPFIKLQFHCIAQAVLGR